MVVLPIRLVYSVVIAEFALVSAAEQVQSEHSAFSLERDMLGWVYGLRGFLPLLGSIMQ